MSAGSRDADAARDPYGTFLHSADVPTWRACAHHAVERVGRAREGDRCRALAEALCIIAYLSWLCRVSGDPDTQAEADARYRDLLTVLDEVSTSAVGPGIDRCWGIALAWQGFRVRARGLLENAGALGVEAAPLVLPENDVTALATLRPLVAAAAAGGSFLPAVSILANSLVNVGAVREAHALVDACGWPPTEPLLVDVLGSAFERLGQWKAAYEVYKTSTWPSLRYRAAITSAITGGSTPLEIDASTITMLTEQVELDQRQISRRVTFLNAVRWQPVESWLLELEMGKLAFAQRRDAEAGCLWRALNEARDRLERLLIARELFGYGLPRDARALLEREGVLQADTHLTHVETTVLLSCYRFLSQDERADLVGRAARRIVADHRAGLLGAAAPTYGQRLVTILEAVDRDLAPQVRARLGPELVGDRPATQWHGHPLDDAASVTSRLDFLAAEDVRVDIGVERLAHEVAQRFPGAATSFGLRLTVATELRDRYRSLIDQARTVRPSVPRDAVPIAYDHDGDGDRTIVLCDRLRARLAAPDDVARKAAEEQLAAFRREERVLVDQWDRLQREARFGALQSAASYGHALVGSLRDLVGPLERACPHPVLRELFGHVADDVAGLLAHVQEQLLLIEQELSDPSGPPAVIPA